MASIEIAVAVGAAGVVRVGCGPEAELVRVVAIHVLHGDAVLKRLTTVAASDVIDAADGRRQAEENGGNLVAGELVVGREQGVDRKSTRLNSSHHSISY